mgnify:CR=1 FL=1
MSYKKKFMKKIRLGVNIDHVATIRNARGEGFPNLVDVVKVLKNIKVDSITVHLREDRRHIKDEDVLILKKTNLLPLNLEMAATQEMLDFCLDLKPYACCIVPEKREELTTEGGLNVIKQKKYLKDFISKLRSNGVRTSLFIEPDIGQVAAAKEINASAVELHTGKYSRLFKDKLHFDELKIIKNVASKCSKLKLECHAGHGLDYFNVTEISRIPQIEELNVGHFLVANSIFDGIEKTVKKFQKIIN